MARFDYEPFGLVAQATGSQAGERQRFAGKAEDAGTGLHYFNARYYDPEVGRFTSVDPARDGLNWYSYCASNPLRLVDPEGTTPESTRTLLLMHFRTIDTAADRHGLPRELLYAVVYKENIVREWFHEPIDRVAFAIRGDASVGMCQVSLRMAALLDSGVAPETHGQLNYKGREEQKSWALSHYTPRDRNILFNRLLDPAVNIEYAARTLAFMRDARGGYGENEMTVWLSDYNRGLTLDSGPSRYGEGFWEAVFWTRFWGFLE